MGRMEPEALDALFGILDDIVTNFLEELVIGQVESAEIDLQQFDVLASGQNSSNVTEEIVQHLLLCEVPVPKTFQLDIRYLSVSRLIRNVLLEFLEFCLTAEEVRTADMQFGDLCWVEKMSHMSSTLYCLLLLSKIKMSPSLVEVLPSGLAHVPVRVLLVYEHHALPFELITDHISLLVFTLLASLITLVDHPDYFVLLEPVLLGHGGRVEEI